MKRLPQVEPHRVWPSGDGWTVAVLARTPDGMARTCGLKFEEGVDGLDAYELAAIQDEKVGQLWFFRHKQSPDPGVEIVVDARVTRDDALQTLIRTGIVDDAAIVWRAETNTDPLLPHRRRA